MFRPVTTQAAFELVVEQVRAAVDLALLVPGDRLPPERELAALLDVSRPTLREALRVLAMSGYVSVRRGAAGGAYVLERPRGGPPEHVRKALLARRQELTALLEWRRLVEAEAAALAATRVSDDQLRALRARLVESGSRQVPPGPERWRAADSRFHMAVAEASDNLYILHAVHRVRAELAHAPDAARAAAARHGHSTERRLAAFLGNL